MHEVQLRRRQQLAYERYLGERGTIEMPDAAGPQRGQDARFGIAFDGIEHIAGKRPTKRRAAAAIAAGRRHSNGSLGRARATTASIEGRTARPNGREETKRACAIARSSKTRRRHAAPHAECAGGGMTDRGESSRRGERAPGRQTIVRGLRIACRNISVSLKEAGPRVAGSCRKGRVTS